nr:heterogeneous nuclear ribonucleoprotein F-like isoform X1 [Maniola hyperantus]
MLGAGDGGHIIKLRGLPFSTTVQDVLEFLGGVSVVNGEEGVHLTEVRPGRPSGECFVEVESLEDVDQALKRDKEHMGKRYIEVFSTDRQDMEWALNAMRQSENGFDSIPVVNDDYGIVKLRGLPFGCSKEEIEQFFDGLTVAQDGVHLLSDHTGRASGEAFVYFVDKQSAQDALGRDREKIGHRYIEVFISSPDEVRAYSSRVLGDEFKSSRGYRATPYDRNDRYSGGRFGGRGGRGGPIGRGNITTLAGTQARHTRFARTLLGFSASSSRRAAIVLRRTTATTDTPADASAAGGAGAGLSDEAAGTARAAAAAGGAARATACTCAAYRSKPRHRISPISSGRFIP